ncbi:nucleotidyltransferase family protein [Desulfovibrio cuneatus]|uniref:nucleotidyltransferase family protein n=1 Tax=Desulfovibrio cuneatus TaxID=159728 RepID=UPI000411E7A0|nr:nucleotidyltransferase family protein [Desulfovibrio cuneatus]
MCAPGIAALVLAAGQGSRLGGSKQLLPWQGKPLLAHVLEQVDALPAIHHKACIVGHAAQAVQEAVQGYAGWQFLENTHWAQGQSTSLGLGLHWVQSLPQGEGVQAVLVLLGDMPLVLPATLHALIDAFSLAQQQRRPVQAVLPTYQGQRGNPVLLGCSLFPALGAITGDAGARGVLATLQEKLLLPVPDPGILYDIDTPEAYAKLLCSPKNPE